jgi:DNA-binding beta-propeller fold protein YncE
MSGLNRKGRLSPARATAISALGVVLAGCAVLAGCSSTTRTTPSPAQLPRPPVRPAGAVTHSLPGCTTAVQPAPALPAAAVTLTAVHGLSGEPASPFDVVVTANGRFAFVSLDGAASIAVYRIGQGRMPVLVHLIRVPGISPFGEALTPGDRYLLVADGGGGAEVIGVTAAEAGSGAAVLGLMDNASGHGAIQVSVAPDGQYAFVTLENSDGIAVYDLPRAISRGFGSAGYIGTIPTAVAPTDTAISPNHRWMYATSEDASLHSPVGTLAMISLAKAETNPAAAVVGSIRAGCNPVRVITSADGRVVWVTARASDALLAFSAARLRTDPGRALLADVRLGELPADLALTRAGTRIVVADSDRFDIAGRSASLALVDVPDALAGRPALLGYLPAGKFPRQVAAEPDGRVVLVTNFNSGQLETVDMANLP